VISAGGRNLRLALALCVVLGASVFGAGGAAADEEPEPKPPLYQGGMSFHAIQGPEGPEQFSWTVRLDTGQNLVQVDERHAEVRFDEDHVAVGIEAVAAHDAEGTSVPTTLAVSEGDVITLTVHHRAGNPLAGGAPFDYPVVAGVGWEGGFHTYQVQMPPRETPQPAPTCVVPKLTGRSLGGSRARLANAGCKLGAVRGKRGKGAKVVKQCKPPGTVLGAGARVAVKLG